MKYQKLILPVLTGLFNYQFSFAQLDASTCNLFHTGKFSYFDSLNHTVFVTRKKQRQIEYNHQTKIKTILKIKWFTSCEYELTQIWTNNKSLRKYNRTRTKVIISAIIDGNKGYQYNCSCADSKLNLKSSGIMRKEDYP